MKICSHVIRNDVGLAPNPFHGYCTTALCTPSHMNARLEPGDWLIGHSPRAAGNRLVYAMHLAEVLIMEDYFDDGRFQAKKPNPSGSPDEQCGDNFYFRESGRWKRMPSRFHNSPDAFVKDVGKNLAGRPVFIATDFYYFGAKRVPIPAQFESVIRKVQGIQYTREPTAGAFVAWLRASFTPGILGPPRDLSDRSRESGRMITDHSAASGLAAGEVGQARSSVSLPQRSRARGCQ